MEKHDHTHIIEQVPVDYYQKGVAKNIFQRIWHGGRLRETLKFLRESKLLEKGNMKVLDVGCASGWFISEICIRYPKGSYAGVDIYEDAITYAKKQYPHISFHVADAHMIPFEDDFFNLVVCTNVLEHAVDPKKIMEEIGRVLKPDGRVIVGMDSENWLFSFVWQTWLHFQGRVWKHAHLHKLKEHDLYQLFRDANFAIEKKSVFHLGMAMIFLLKNE